MRISPTFPPRSAAIALTMLTAAGLGACTGSFNPVRDVATAVGAGPQIAPTPEFVARSRPENLEYLPVGTARPDVRPPARTAEEVKAAEAEMDALRARNEAAGATAVQLGATPAPQPVRLPVKKTTSEKTP